MAAGLIFLALAVSFTATVIYRGSRMLRAQASHHRRWQQLRKAPRAPMFTDIHRYHQAEIEAGNPLFTHAADKLKSTWMIDPETGRPGGEF